MRLERDQLLTSPLRFGIALVAAITLHGAVLAFVTGMRMPSPQPPRVIVGLLLKTPTPNPVEPSIPAPQPPASEVPSPEPAPPPVRAKPVAAKKPLSVDEPAQKAHPRPTAKPALPTATAAAAAPVNTEALQTEAVAVTESALSPPSFQADYLHNPHPRYPLMSRKRREEGEVHLQVRVDTQGRPESVRIHISSGYPRLDQAASSAVQDWRFVPAKLNGLNVAAWVVVPIQFNLEK